VSGPIKFDRPVDGRMAPGNGPIRFSTAERLLREQGSGSAADELVRDKLAAGSECPVHGKLEDPIVVVSPEMGRVAFCCPRCSAPEILEAWEREGAEAEKGRN
jgi:hypothetical protein